jgi:hypothetical protein
MPVPEFDEDGYLPPGRHPATADEMKAALVDAFEEADQRAMLFEAWTAHKDSLDYLLPVEHHWVGGSFVSTKPEPGDVDTVAFFDGTAFDALPLPARRLISYMCQGHGAQPWWGCDSFMVAIYPEDHPNHEVATAQPIAYWNNVWGHTRDDDQGHRRPRGYLEVM